MLKQKQEKKPPRIAIWVMVSVGTSVLFGVAISAVGTILHYNIGNVSITLVLFLLIGSIPGVFLGVKLTSKISPRKLITVFSMIILVAAIFLLSRGFEII